MMDIKIIFRNSQVYKSVNNNEYSQSSPSPFNVICSQLNSVPLVTELKSGKLYLSHHKGKF